VHLDQAHQTIEGFGINDTWSSAAFTSAEADSLFTTTGTGIGLSMLRVGMSDSGSFYNSFESTNISALTSRAASDAKVIGSCWTPPASCKTNGNVNNGGHLCSSTNASGSMCSSSAASTCYDTWSTTIASFAKTNKLYAMSIGNEPDFASCGMNDPCNGNYPTTVYTANEMVAWVKVAGPKLQAAGVKVIAPEASEWNHQWSNVSAGPDVSGKNSSDPLACGFPPSNAACNTGGGYDYGHYMAKDATAWAAFDIIGVHEYDSQVASPWPSDVTAAKKEVWQTEMSGVKWWPQQGPSTDIANGLAVAGWIHSAIVDGGASAWFWWWLRAYNTNDNEGLYTQAGGTSSWTDTKRHYTLGNFSKFVRPGYTRVDVSGSLPSGVLLSAYKGSDGTLVIVGINNGSADATVPLTITGGTAPASLTPNVTSASASLTAGTAVTVSGGALMATLPASSVTSFVGK
jgi:glucuronoarabinoxylan endo-1,4-beta-xylanase